MSPVFVSVRQISDLIRLARGGVINDEYNPTVFVSVTEECRTNPARIENYKINLNVAAPTYNGSGIVYLYRQTLYKWVGYNGVPEDEKKVNIVRKAAEDLREDINNFVVNLGADVIGGTVVIPPEFESVIVGGEPIVDWDSETHSFTRPHSEEPAGVDQESE